MDAPPPSVKTFLPSGIACISDLMYAAFITSFPDKLVGMRIRVRCEKANPS